MAKLRLHSESTVDILDELTTSLGEAFRHFTRVVCPSYHTKELPRETKARNRKKAATDASNSKSKSSLADALRKAGKEPTGGAIAKTYNIETYKHHSSGDVVDAIRRFGTTESYSSRVVCPFHFE